MGAFFPECHMARIFKDPPLHTGDVPEPWLDTNLMHLVILSGQDQGVYRDLLSIFSSVPVF